MAASFSISQSIKLNSGRTIPAVGLGVYLIHGRTCIDSVSNALRIGYRHIDTAAYYENEAECGRAVRDSGIPRNEIFVTSKLWLSQFGYANAKKGVKEALKKSGLSYLDLMLMHAPGDPEDRVGTWQALEEAHEQGLLKSIGVSNFGVAHIEKLLKTAKVVPAVNQVELTPMLQRKELVSYCTSKGIALQAYSPLGKATRDILYNATVTKVAKKTGATNAQVLIRWSLQKGFIPLPKSSNPQRQKENLEALSMNDLDDEDMRMLDGLESGYVTAWDPTVQAAV